MKGQKKSDRKKLNKKSQIRAKIVALSIVFCVTVIVFVLARIQSARLDRGLIDVCAAQQDAYVQLVLDQINLKENRDNQEIVENILGTLDASSNKYWTFSDDQTMLFVKDVLETNKYKGFTAATYFVSDTAKEFFEGLRTNRVTHSVITIDDNQYIASGVRFNYQGADYKLCLLTNKIVLLENNQLLRARTEVIVIIYGVTILFALTALCLTTKIREMQLEKDENLVVMKEMNTHIQNLNDQLAKWDIHDTRNNVWNKEALMGFAQKLQDRRAYPFTIVMLETENDYDMKRLLETAHYVLDHNNLRFMMTDNLLMLLYVQCDMEAVKYSLRPMTEKYSKIVSIRAVSEEMNENLVDCCQEILEKYKDDPFGINGEN